MYADLLGGVPKTGRRRTGWGESAAQTRAG